MTQAIFNLSLAESCCQSEGQDEIGAMEETTTVMERAAGFGLAAAEARRAGDEQAAERNFQEASKTALAAAARLATRSVGDTAWLGAMRAAAGFALDCGDVAAAFQVIHQVFATNAALRFTDEWTQLVDVTTWPDAWLVAAVRRDPPHEPALDVLAARYWKPLFARCQFFTLDRQRASDLAQEAWRRLLRARRALKPGGNFPAYLTMIAGNIWRDWHRASFRAGAMADHRMLSLEAQTPTGNGDSVMLGEAVPDLNRADRDAQRRLMIDIDEALESLDPLLRAVLVARFIDGESCADIGRRYGRTEQTVSGWVRQAVRELKVFLEVGGSVQETHP